MVPPCQRRCERSECRCVTTVRALRCRRAIPPILQDLCPWASFWEATGPQAVSDTSRPKARAPYGSSLRVSAFRMPVGLDTTLLSCSVIRPLKRDTFALRAAIPTTACFSNMISCESCLEARMMLANFTGVSPHLPFSAWSVCLFGCSTAPQRSPKTGQ
jgi:hypothetical protein